jgi:hypothetical protein
VGCAVGRIQDRIPFIQRHAGITIPQPQGLNKIKKCIIFMGFVREVFNYFPHDYYFSRLLLNIFNVEFSMWKGDVRYRYGQSCGIFNFQTWKVPEKFHVENSTTNFHVENSALKIHR